MNTRQQSAFTLLEVLISIVIISIGLIGLAKLQARMQLSEMESYQRAQALLLINDISNRMLANPKGANDYLTSVVGGSESCPTDKSNRGKSDLADWCQALQGAGELEGQSKLGAMLGGRGCIESIGGREYMVTVAWQGLGPIAAPPTSVSCATGLYDNTTSCTGDLCRRTVTSILRVPNL